MSKTPFGGFIKDPPEDCPKSQFFRKSENGIWLDINICHSCPNIKKCERRKDSLTKKKAK